MRVRGFRNSSRFLKRLDAVSRAGMLYPYWHTRKASRAILARLRLPRVLLYRRYPA